MATATPDMRDDLRELITCSVCLETYTSPRQLPCMHMFCVGCIQSLVQPGGARIVCPVCRCHLRLPPGGGGAFPVSFLMNSLCEMFHKHEAGKSSTSLCMFCQDEGEQTPGTWLCMQCCQAMCLPCKKHHKRALGHEVVESSSVNQVNLQEIVKKKSQKCPTHKNEDLRFFCETCKKLACMTCMVTEHRNPRCYTKELNNVFAAYYQKLEVYKRKLETINEQCKKCIKNTDGSTAGFDSVVGDVRTKAEEFRKAIDDWESEIVTKIHTKLKGSEDAPITTLQEVKNKQEQVEKHLKNLTSLATGGTYVEVVRNLVSDEKQLEAAAAPIEMSKIKKWSVDAKTPQVDEIKSVLEWKPIVMATKELEFNVPYKISAMALTPDGNIVVCGWRINWAAIYTQTGELLRTIHLPNGTQTWGVACSQDRIFISDLRGHIYAYSFTGQALPVMERNLPHGDCDLHYQNGFLYVSSYKIDRIRRYNVCMSPYGKNWSYMNIPAGILNGASGMKVVDHVDLVLIASNIGNYVSGYVEEDRREQFRIDTFRPLSVECDDDGYILVPAMVNDQPTVTIHDQQGNYKGTVQGLFQGTVKPVGIVCPSPGQMLCGCEVAEGVFKIVSCSYKVIDA